jgi:hypothetical protein
VRYSETDLFVVLQSGSGQWRDVKGPEVTVWPFDPPEEYNIAGTSGIGYPQWKTKRLKAARKAIKVLSEASELSTPQVETALCTISEFIARNLPPLSATNLPRGYRLVLNLDSKRSLELDGTLFDPTAAEALPSAAAAGRLRTDIATGWLSELAESWPEFPASRLAQRVRQVCRKL